MSHHELPEHDALDTIDEKVLKGELFFERHGKKIIIAVAAVVIVALGIFAYHRFVQVPKAEKATAQMFVAEDSFIAGQDSLALKGQGAGAPGFEAIAKNFSGTDAANLAHAYSGICLYDQGKYQEALAELKKFSTELPAMRSPPAASSRLVTSTRSSASTTRLSPSTTRSRRSTTPPPKQKA